VTNPALAAGLADVLTEHLGRPVEVAGLIRLSGGSSHETWGLVATTGDGAVTAPLVLRRDFDRGMLDTDVRAEYELLTTLHDVGLPVPRPWLCVTEDSPLDLPFMIMERVAGTDLRKDLARPGHGHDLPALARQAIELQARIHAVDPAGLPGLDPLWGPHHELARWSAVIADAEPVPDPLLVAALAWLGTHLPDPPTPCLVHGDFKANNLLITPAAELVVIDWELSHLGDPIEDLAWTMLWRTDWDIVGGLHTREAYVRAYSDLTGRQVGAEALRFWRILALVKLWAMFLTGTIGEAPRPTLLLMGRAGIWIADQLAQELAPVVVGMSGGTR
jgi:aminoglycoside phosphotransferase (APT) family kinase protein